MIRSFLQCTLQQYLQATATRMTGELHVGNRRVMVGGEIRAVRMDPGVVMETKDGQRIAMIGDEVSYVMSLLDRETRK
jgi:hypothetical protein